MCVEKVVMLSWMMALISAFPGADGRSLWNSFRSFNLLQGMSEQALINVV